MKLKMLIAIIIGLCVPFMTALTTFADSKPIDAMIEKQKEVDKMIFEEKQAELAEKGITVTYTAPLETSIEIGIQPYNEETINYFNEIFGVNNVSIVDGGQQAVIMSSNVNELLRDEETSEENGSVIKTFTILAAIIVLCGGISAFILRKKRIKN
ncbi:copper amine oxidase domain-containing protein [Neobacillus bataviensis LMG 21833]|uniref:Copper amine oxidase domain-containing protein n=1 Tax=Neobacillus bataviensis LMG 21833 TaxID=1117379 RepID=K6DBM7_9BACI|nr:hypothetical protein [Neobacillus bataviensis]EKN65468.1 copper amine oxidase domain-containing protein [Neobacillus bataviensis LMG 21833]